MADRVLKRHDSPEYGSEADNRDYLRRNAAQKNRLMRQFLKLESGNGNTKAFRDGYDKIDWGHGGPTSRYDEPEPAEQLAERLKRAAGEWPPSGRPSHGDPSALSAEAQEALRQRIEDDEKAAGCWPGDDA